MYSNYNILSINTPLYVYFYNSTSNNSVTLNIDNYKATGSLFTPCTIYWPYGGSTNADEYSTLSPNFSSSAGGVFYTFKVGGIGASGEMVTV